MLESMRRYDPCFPPCRFARPESTPTTMPSGMNGRVATAPGRPLSPDRNRPLRSRYPADVNRLLLRQPPTIRYAYEE
ncbi:hypothetical protein FRACA_2970005 [Frankia canadensis]|uniref:Uncharacterized protein n=1 Tax=Frankia canadensis TaxID=1836972 RepID=A0A2I2KTK4_9ACTN|nr:hypothetical protein FRACA_2970005 [Frankia canadensis]SOU56269.1 hypothetical protein FRACA_2970005 [Frankia canadensis]